VDRTVLRFPVAFCTVEPDGTFSKKKCFVFKKENTKNKKPKQNKTKTKKQKNKKEKKIKGKLSMVECTMRMVRVFKTEVEYRGEIYNQGGSSIFFPKSLIPLCSFFL
jgi:hypothetical protein